MEQKRGHVLRDLSKQVEDEADQDEFVNFSEYYTGVVAKRAEADHAELKQRVENALAEKLKTPEGREAARNSEEDCKRSEQEAEELRRLKARAVHDFLESGRFPL